MIRKNINLPKWQDEYLKFVSKKYDRFSESKIIRLAISFYILSIAEVLKIDSGITLDEAIEESRKAVKSGKPNWDGYEKILFAARKVVEIRLQKSKGG